VNKVDLASFIARYSWADGMLHSLMSLLNQKRTLDFGPTKNTQCWWFFFFSSLGS